MTAPGPIALFDSGEGGLTVLQQLIARFPGERFLYGADSLHFPYGEKSLKAVHDWFLAFLEFFLAEGARAVVVACNTATAAALEDAKARSPVPVIGVVEPAVQKAAAVSANRRIGVLSTEATWRSRLYPDRLRALNERLEVIAKPCPILVVMAENGYVDGVRVEDAVRACVEPVLNQGVDTMILGCTHFPHMREVFDRVVGHRAAIVDPGVEIGDHLHEVLQLNSAPAPTQPVAAWTTGNPARFTAVAKKLCPHIPLVTRPLTWQEGRIVPEVGALTDRS